MRFKVVNVDEVEGDLIIQFNAIDEQGNPITKGEHAWFIELWRPKTLGLIVKEGEIFEITFHPITKKEDKG